MIRVPEAIAQRSTTALVSRARLPRAWALLCGGVLLGLARGVPAQSQFEQRSPQRYLPAVADTTADVVVADFDGDGDPDVLTANEYQLTRLYRNDGGGIFVDVTTTNLPLVTSLLLRRIGVGDIDGDGSLDVLLTAGRSANGPPLLLVNDGTGRFADETAARLPASAVQGIQATLRSASRPLFGDVDGDGDNDLVVPDQGREVRLFLNDGAGFFTDDSAVRMPSTLNRNREAALVDLDGDLDLDLFLANGGQDRLYLNDGLGFFTDVTVTNLPVESNLGAGPEYMTLVDADLDLDLDVVFGGGSGSVLCLNDGTGVFSYSLSSIPPFPSSVGASAVAVGDVDGDLDPDLVFGGTEQSLLFLGDGTGAFVSAPFPAPGPGGDAAGGLALVDADGDGDLDLLMGRLGHDFLFLNEGAGAFTNASTERVPWGTDAGSAVAVADIDRDGDPDLLVTMGYTLGGFSSFDRAYLNDGTGAFPIRQTLPASNAVALATGDVDGDADLDVLVGNVLFSNQLYLNDGQGGLSQVSPGLPLDADNTLAVALVDVDGDADLDALFGNYQGQSRLYRNAGDGTFTDVTAGRLPARADQTRALAVADFDGDGDLDLVLGNDGQQSRMYVNEGLGAFFDGTATRMPPLARATRALGVGDLDGDGDLDLVLGNDGQAGLYLNNGAGKLLDYTDRMPEQSEEAWAVAIGDVDEDGDLDVALGNRSAAGVGGQNRLLLNDGTARFTDSGRLPADLEVTTALVLVDVDGDRDPDLVVTNLAESISLPHENRVYLNLHRQLDALTLPLLGRTYEIRLDSQPGYGSAPHTAFVVFGSALLPQPIPISPVVGELALVPDFFHYETTTIPAPLGSAVLELAVPVDPALVGETFYAQALILSGRPAHLTGWLQDTFGL